MILLSYSIIITVSRQSSEAGSVSSYNITLSQSSLVMLCSTCVAWFKGTFVHSTHWYSGPQNTDLFASTTMWFTDFYNCYHVVDSQVDNLSQFRSFFEDTWLVRNLTYPNGIFFDVEQVGTNSHVEGWHNHLKKLLRKPHPWVYWIYLTRTDGGYISFFVTGWRLPQRMKCAIIKDLKINEVKTI